MIPDILNRFEYAEISIPMAVLIWIMIYPMMIPVMLMLVRIANKTKGRFL